MLLADSKIQSEEKHDTHRKLILFMDLIILAQMSA